MQELVLILPHASAPRGIIPFIQGEMDLSRQACPEALIEVDNNGRVWATGSVHRVLSTEGCHCQFISKGLSLPGLLVQDCHCPIYSKIVLSLSGLRVQGCHCQVYEYRAVTARLIQTQGCHCQVYKHRAVTARLIQTQGCHCQVHQ